MEYDESIYLFIGALHGKSLDEISKIDNVYPISEKSWIDIGEWDEYKKSLKILNI